MCTEPSLDRFATTLNYLAGLYLRDPDNAPLPTTYEGLEMLIDAIARYAGRCTAYSDAILVLANRMPHSEWGVQLLTRASPALAF